MCIYIPSHVSLANTVQLHANCCIDSQLFLLLLSTIVRGALPCISADKMSDDGFCLFCSYYHLVTGYKFSDNNTQNI